MPLAFHSWIFQRSSPARQHWTLFKTALFNLNKTRLQSPLVNFTSLYRLGCIWSLRPPGADDRWSSILFDCKRSMRPKKSSSGTVGALGGGSERWSSIRWDWGEKGKWIKLNSGVVLAYLKSLPRTEFSKMIWLLWQSRGSRIYSSTWVVPQVRPDTCEKANQLIPIKLSDFRNSFPVCFTLSFTSGFVKKSLKINLKTMKGLNDKFTVEKQKKTLR